jgi:transcriptional regulator with XRE-family HTH domain
MDTDLAKQIGASARTARTRLGLSQADAAERAGISAEFYARIERGGTLPSTPTLVSMANALEVSADVLLGRARDQAPRRHPPKIAAGESAELRRLLRRLRAARPKTLRLLNLLARALEDRR